MNYALNFPLSDGVDDESYEAIYRVVRREQSRKREAQERRGT